MICCFLDCFFSLFFQWFTTLWSLLLVWGRRWCLTPGRRCKEPRKWNFNGTTNRYDTHYKQLFLNKLCLEIWIWQFEAKEALQEVSHEATCDVKTSRRSRCFQMHLMFHHVFVFISIAFMCFPQHLPLLNITVSTCITSHCTECGRSCRLPSRFCRFLLKQEIRSKPSEKLNGSKVVFRFESFDFFLSDSWSRSWYFGLFVKVKNPSAYVMKVGRRVWRSELVSQVASSGFSHAVRRSETAKQTDPSNLSVWSDRSQVYHVMSTWKDMKLA